MIRRIVIVVLGMTLVALLIFIGMQERMVLVVEELESGKQETYIPADGTFQLGYTHSVLLTPVDEYFEINDWQEPVNFVLSLGREYIVDKDY